MEVFDMHKNKYWTDHCHHPEDSYVGSGDYIFKNGSDFVEVQIDVYAYQTSLGTDICIRFGPNPEDYASPGSVRQVVAFATHPKDTRYRHVVDLLNHFGKFTYVINKEQ